MTQRTCNTCHTTKDLSPEFFYPSKKHEGGYNTQCRACNVAKTHAQEKARREAYPTFDPSSQTETNRLATARQFYRKREIDNNLLVGLHHCSACQSTLPIADFAVDDKAYSGYQSVCRSCKKGANNAE